ncbi:hypothetical protein L7F22_054343 [Adiantum nelumboides]|nr:hypothetical protein [Adiantum nelumboides]
MYGDMERLAMLYNGVMQVAKSWKLVQYHDKTKCALPKHPAMIQVLERVPKITVDNAVKDVNPWPRQLTTDKINSVGLQVEMLLGHKPRWRMGTCKASTRKEKLVGHRSRTLDGHYKKDKGPDLKIECPIFKGKKHDDPDVHIQAFEQKLKKAFILECTDDRGDEDILCELDRIKQGKLLVRKYVQNIKELARRLNEPPSEKRMRAWFLSGFNSRKLREQEVPAPIKKFIELVHRALKVEQQAKKEKSIHRGRSNTSTSETTETKKSRSSSSKSSEDDKKKKKKGSWSKNIDDMSRRIFGISRLRGASEKTERWCTKCKAKNHTTEECTQCNYCKVFGHEWTSCKIKIRHLKEEKDLSMIAFASMEPVAAIIEQPQTANTNTNGYNGRGRERGRGGNGASSSHYEQPQTANTNTNGYNGKGRGRGDKEVVDALDKVLDDAGRGNQMFSSNHAYRYTPQQNGVAEHKNMHIIEVACALMSEKNIPPCYWAEAASTTVYTMNRTATVAIHDMTPKEKFTGKKPDVSHFKVLGCIAYVHVPDELRTKLDPKAKKCVFIGYSLEQKGYKCYNPSTHQVRVSRNVVFDEMATWYADVKDDIGADVKKSVVEISNVQSQVLSGPQGSPTSSHVANRGVKDCVQKQVLQAQLMHSSGFEHSLDEELGIPSVRTPDVRRLHAENRAPGSNAEPHRSRRNRYPVDRLTYDGYVAKHFAFMAKVT